MAPKIPPPSAVLPPFNPDPVASPGWSARPPRDAAAMASALRMLLDQPDLRRAMGANAAADALARFSLRQQADAYLSWFRDIRETHQSRARG